jgi:hypothetical protein
VVSSAAPGFERFRRVVLEDRALQARMRQVPEWDELLARLIEMGEGGARAGADEVRRALRESRRAWLQRWVG